MDLSQFLNEFEKREKISKSVVLEILYEQWMEKMRHSISKEENVIWVSSLVYCKQRSLFEQEYFFLFGIKPQLILGSLVHLGLQQILKDLGCKVEVEFEKEIQDYKIKGRVDAIDNDTVYEIKFAKDLRENRPYEHHIYQLRIYLWLTGYEHGKLIYVTPSRIVEFDESNPMDDDELIMFIDNWRSPRWEWECNYCDFSQICPYKIERR